MPFLLLKLLGIGKWLREAATGVFGLIRRYPLPALCIVLLLALAWQSHGKSRAIKQRDAAIAGRATDREAYTAAQADAERMQREADHVAIDRQLALNDQVRMNHASLEQTRVSAVADYASAHPVRVCHQTAGSAPGGTGLAAVSGDPGLALGGQADGDLVTIPASHLDAFSATEVQNRERGEYLRGLIAIGWAVPESEEAK